MKTQRTIVTSAALALLVGGLVSCSATSRCALCREKGLSLQQTPRLEYAVAPGSEAETELAALEANRDRALARVEAFFGRRAPRPVRVYVFASVEAAAPQRVGTVWPDELEAFVVYGRGRWAYEKHNAGHELTHLFTDTTSDFRATVTAPALLDEGLAEYLSGSFIDPHLALTQFELASGRHRRPLQLPPRVLERGWSGLYPVAGSFVKFLVEGLPDGKRKVLELLARTIRRADQPPAEWSEFVTVLEQVFATPVDQLVRAWNEALAPWWDAPFPFATSAPQLTVAIEAAGLHAPWSVAYLSFKWYPQVVAWDDLRRVTFSATPDDTWSVVASEVR